MCSASTEQEKSLRKKLFHLIWYWENYICVQCNWCLSFATLIFAEAYKDNMLLLESIIGRHFATFKIFCTSFKADIFGVEAEGFLYYIWHIWRVSSDVP